MAIEIVNGIITKNGSVVTLPRDNGGSPVALLAGIDDNGINLARISASGFSQAKVSVADNIPAAAMGATGTIILASDSARAGHILVNTGSVIVYVGGSDAVTADNGIPIAVGAALSLDPQGAAYVGDIWGITAGAAGEVRGLVYTE